MFRILLILFIMAFPTVQERLTQEFSSDASTHTVNLPTTVNADELLLIIFFANENSTFSPTTPTGWTDLEQALDSNSLYWISYKQAAGTEGGGSVDFDTGALSPASSILYRISGWNSIEITASYDKDLNSTTADPPSLTPSYGAADTLWIASCVQLDAPNTVSSYPTNYTNGQESTHPEGLNASAERELNATSEDPGTFTISAADHTLAHTLAVEPGSLGAGGVTEMASVSMGTYSLGLTDAGVATAGAVLTNNITYNITDAGQATAGASLTNDLTYGMTESGQATAGGDITVNISFGQTTDGSASAVGAISQAIAYGLTSSGTAITGVTSVSLSFGNSFDMSAAGTATAAASLSMDIQHALTTAGQAVSAAGISLPYTLDISISASAITGDVTFADGRTLSISVDRRTKAIDSDSRTLGIESENRTLPIEPND